MDFRVQKSEIATTKYNMELTNKYKLLGFFWSQSFELRILILFDFEGHDYKKAINQVTKTKIVLVWLFAPIVYYATDC